VIRLRGDDLRSTNNRIKYSEKSVSRTKYIGGENQNAAEAVEKYE